ncbi:MAG: glycogen synthase [Cryomorphaceae bacterium]|nr:MAG: glycogen synthase [Cryomorphaceae bacterium]
MAKTKVLYVSQEITPYLEANEISTVSRMLPQGMQEKGREIRVFMPRYGCINERRHQLHEVIRLSGMNLIINDNDHPLILKVASIPSARMQVYFIDNEDFFQRKAVHCDSKGKFFNDNDERSIFFVRGVIETVKKLGWAPDIIHCHGWMTAIMPAYLKKIINEDPHFSDSKVVFSAYGSGFEGTLEKGMVDKLRQEGFAPEDLSLLNEPTHENLTRFAIDHSDGVVKGTSSLQGELEDYVNSLSKPVLAHTESDALVAACSEFYDRVLEESGVLVE